MLHSRNANVWDCAGSQPNYPLQEGLHAGL